MGRRYLLAPRDLLTVPRLKSARVGDRLVLSEIHEVGSRDYTLRVGENGTGTIPAGILRVEATVVEHTKGAMERIVKFKRRKHYQKTITHSSRIHAYASVLSSLGNKKGTVICNCSVVHHSMRTQVMTVVF